MRARAFGNKYLIVPPLVFVITLNYGSVEREMSANYDVIDWLWTVEKCVHYDGGGGGG